MSRRALSGLLVIFALTIPPISAADDGLPYLATISIERAAGESGHLGDTVRSVLHVTDSQATSAALSAVDGIAVTATDDLTVAIEMIARPTLSGEPQTLHLQSSWVIDFDEDSVQQLLARVNTAREQMPTADDLITEVFEHIDNKTYSRSFDLASRVAASGEGDCTEHAVLLVALARANGLPARYVTGNLILETESDVYAFGHAWAEIHDGERWRIKDATRPERDPAVLQVRYLPLHTLTDEGPGYGFSMGYSVNSMPVRISDLANMD